MKIKYPCFAFILTGLMSLTSTRSIAAEPAVFFYFENNSDPSVPANSGEAPFSFHYQGDTQQTTTQYKFGKGSMLIGETKGKASFSTTTGFASAPSEFNDGISKLTITAWVRPASRPEGAANSFNREGGFNVFGRAVGGRNPGYFNYDFSYKGFNFSYYNDATKRLQAFKSSPIQTAESDEWVHMAVTFDQGKITFYFNGLPVGDADGSAAGATSISEPQGNSQLLGFFSSLPGDCADDFGFFVGRALTEPEIDAIYNKGLAEFVKPAAPPKK